MKSHVEAGHEQLNINRLSAKASAEFLFAGRNNKPSVDYSHDRFEAPLPGSKWIGVT